MSNIEAFRQSIQVYLKRGRVNWGLLAHELGYTREHVSRILSGKAKMPEGFERHVVMGLAKLGCIRTRDQARNLLRLMDIPDFSLVDWQESPLAMLGDAVSSDFAVGKDPPTTASMKLLYIHARPDRDLHDRLVFHLSFLPIQEIITSWYSYEIIPGEDWKQEAEDQLNSADIILLLVSSYFLISDVWYSIVSRALERHRRGEARVIPVILRPVDWESTPLGKLQALPTGGKPITRWADRDEAFVDVLQGISEIMLSLLNQVKKTKEQWILEGKQHYESHQYDEALEAYEKALELDPDDELAREILGRIQIQLGLYDEALTTYEDLLRVSPSASAYLFKGLILQRVGKSVEALAAYQKARECGYSG